MIGHAALTTHGALGAARSQNGLLTPLKQTRWRKGYLRRNLLPIIKPDGEAQSCKADEADCTGDARRAAWETRKG